MGSQSHHARLTQVKRDTKKEKIRSPNDAWKGYLKTWNKRNSLSFPLDPTRRAYSAPYEPQAASANVHIGLWPMAVKLDPAWKTEVSKSAWIKPSMSIHFKVPFNFCYELIFLLHHPFVMHTMKVSFFAQLQMHLFRFSKQILKCWRLYSIIARQLLKANLLKNIL